MSPEVKEEIINELQRQLVSVVCRYDFVLFLDPLLAGALIRGYFIL